MAKQTAIPTTDENPTLTAPVQNPHCADGCGARTNSPTSTFLQGHDQRLISALSFAVVDGELSAFQRALLDLADNPKVASKTQRVYVETGDIQDRINVLNAAIGDRFSIGLAAKFTSAAMRKWEIAGKRAVRNEARVERLAAKAMKSLNETPATRHVMRKLQGPAKGDATHTPVGLTFTMERQAFEAQAKAYLSDKTNLKSATIEKADWDSAFSYWSTQDEAEFDKVPAAKAPVAASTVGETVPDLRGSTVKVKVGRWVREATVVGMTTAGKVTTVEYRNAKGVEVQTDKFTLVD